jgi:hypothetical protein
MAVLKKVAATDPSEVVREVAAWAIARISERINE